MTNVPKSLLGSSISGESVQKIAKETGVENLTDEAAELLGEYASFKIKELLKDGLNFMRHSVRDKLLCHDIDMALKVRDVEPHYGFDTVGCKPFGLTPGGGRNLHFRNEKDMPLTELTQKIGNKIAMEPYVKPHWLVIDGIQPTIPENPPPLSKDMLLLESVNPVKMLSVPKTKDAEGKPSSGKSQKLFSEKQRQGIQLATYEMTVEQQLFYKQMTEACIGCDEAKRVSALESLAEDTGLHEILPRFCNFIVEGIRVNIVQVNFNILFYLMRMTKALLENASLNLEKYLHDLIPAVITCIVSKDLCLKTESEYHYSLRDFSGKLMAIICKKFNTSTNHLQTRVTRIFSKVLCNGDINLPALYGAVVGLCELGSEVIQVFIIPLLKNISDRVEKACSSTNSYVKLAACHIESMVQKYIPSVLNQMKNAPATGDGYIEEYGYLGASLYPAVLKLKNENYFTLPILGDCVNFDDMIQSDSDSLNDSEIDWDLFETWAVHPPSETEDNSPDFTKC